MSDNTKTSLDTMFKYKVAKKVNRLVPENNKIQQIMGDVEAAMREGRKFLWPVALTDEHGLTYGDGTVFTYNDAIAAVYDEIELESNPIVLRSRISLSAANRMAHDEDTFITKMSFRSGVMKKSLVKRLEIETILGRSTIGLGVITGTPSNPSGTIFTATITDATWAPGIWSGLENAVLDVYQTGGTIRKAGVVITSVDHANKTVSFDDGTLAADTDVLYFKGAKTNCFYGLIAQLENAGTLFGISAATYSLWKGNTYAVGGAIAMDKILTGMSLAVGKGGLDEDSILVIPSKRFEKLNNDLAALVRLGREKKAQIGHNYITYTAQFGDLTICPHSCMPEGYAVAFPESMLKKVGATDVNFGFGGGEYFERLESAAGYQLIAQADWSPLISAPAKCVLFTGITDA
jgi:hypothetical protein